MKGGEEEEGGKSAPPGGLAWREGMIAYMARKLLTYTMFSGGGERGE